MVWDMQAALVDKMWILWSSGFQPWLCIKKPWGAFANYQRKTPSTRKSDFSEIPTYILSPTYDGSTPDILTLQ